MKSITFLLLWMFWSFEEEIPRKTGEVKEQKEQKEESVVIAPVASPAPVSISSFSQFLRQRVKITAQLVFGSDLEESPFFSTPSGVHPDHLHENGPRIQQAVIKIERSFFAVPISASYQFDSNNSFSVTMPFVERRDSFVVEGQHLGASDEGIGDVQIDFRRGIFRPGESWNTVAQFNLRFPTGKSVYDSIEAKGAPLGLGHYEAGAGLGVEKLADPVMFTASGGLQYTFPRSFGEIRVKPGYGYSLQTGIAYALTDRWILGEQLYFTRKTDAFLVGVFDTQVGQTSQSYLSHSLIYNSGSYVLRGTFTLGLNNESIDYAIGITYQPF